MNPFNLRLQRLQLPSPLSIRLTAETLNAWLSTDNLGAWMRRRAAQRLLRIRQRRLAVRQATRNYVQRMRKQGQSQVTQLFAKTQKQAIRETIHWMVSTQQLERALADHLVQQAAQWAVSAFKQLVAETDQPQLLWQQLQSSIRELQGHGELTLRVHPSQWKELKQMLSNQPGIKIIADQQLQPLQASLESSLVSVNLDLQRHVNLLTEQLLSQPLLIANSSPEKDERQAAVEDIAMETSSATVLADAHQEVSNE